MYPQNTPDSRIRHFLVQKLLNLFFHSRKFRFGRFTTFRATQHYPLRFFASQSLFGTLTDKVAFNFSRKPKGKRQHLAIDIAPQAIIIFDSLHLNIAIHTLIQHPHNHQKVTPQPRQLRANKHIILLHLF